MKTKQYPSIIDVAQKAGVSTATVSRAMAKPEMLSPRTLNRVREAINQLNYLKDGIDASRKKRRMISVIVPDILDQFFANLLKGISDLARLHSFDLVFFNSDNNEYYDKQAVNDIIADDSEGLIIIPSGVKKELIDMVLSKPALSHVFVDRTIEDARINYVISDDFEGSYLASKYLLDLGHRRILYIGGRKDLSTEINRLAGYKKAVREAGLPLDPTLISEYGFNAEEAYRAGRSLLDHNPNATAIFCANDMIAFGVKHAVEEKGLSIPKDISLIGYGDMPMSDYLSLTTISMPAYEMGRNAFLLLLDLMDGRVKPPKRFILRPSIVFRTSCMKLPG